jgi:hypothetical protein
MKLERPWAAQAKLGPEVQTGSLGSCLSLSSALLSSIMVLFLIKLIPLTTNLSLAISVHLVSYLLSPYLSLRGSFSINFNNSYKAKT